MVTLEEWAALACMTGDAAVQDGVSGIHISTFIHNICYLIVGKLETTRPEDNLSIETYCRDLQLLLREEATRASKGKGKRDYLSAFALFDLDGQGIIDKEEFKKMLVKLRMVEGLAETDYPKILTEFDLDKKGHITLQDFTYFAENAKFGLEKDGFDEEEDEEEGYGIASNTPPLAITNDADTDWLLWFIWKEAFKQDKADPEGVITELEAVCTETEITKDKSSSSTVSLKDFWTLLTESNLRGSMSKTQFDAGTKKFTDYVNKFEGDRLDYVSLCRNIVSMGRGFNSILQEKKKIEDKKYVILKAKLVSELKFSGALDISGRSGHESLRFQKVMRRLDEDGDGQLSVAEFKIALKRIRLRCEKEWTSRMIRRLFDEFDQNRDGLLDTEEFMLFINSESHDHGGKKDFAQPLDEPDDDDGIFKGRRVISDHELFRKVNTIITLSLPLSVMHS